MQQTDPQLDLEACILASAGLGLVWDWEYHRARSLEIPRRDEARALVRVAPCRVPVAAADVPRVRAAAGVEGRAPQAWAGEHYDCDDEDAREGEEESDE